MIWKKYLYKEVLKTLLSFLIGFYLLYIVMDYSIHAQHFSRMEGFNLSCFFTYYLCHIIKRMEMMLPLAFLISIIKVLLQLNQRNELIALFTSGLKTTRFLKPFFVISTTLFAFLLINFEFFVPKSLDYLEDFENKNFKRISYQKYEIPSAYCMPVSDGSNLIFSKYFHEKKMFEDVFYIQSFDKIYQMKTLDVSQSPYIGGFVETFARGEKNELYLLSSEQTHLFNDLKIDFSIRKKAELPFEHRSITQLIQLIQQSSLLLNKSEPKIKTQLYFKLLSPMIPFLVVLAVAPFCMRSSRRIPTFFIYALSLFGFIAFFIILDACVILGESRTITPILAMMLPFGLSFLGWGCHFYRHTCK